MSLRETTEQTMLQAHAAGMAYWRNNRPTATDEQLLAHARTCGWQGEDAIAWLAGFQGAKRRDTKGGI